MEATHTGFLRLANVYPLVSPGNTVSYHFDHFVSAKVVDVGIGFLLVEYLSPLSNHAAQLDVLFPAVSNEEMTGRGYHRSLRILSR